MKSPTLSELMMKDHAKILELLKEVMSYKGQDTDNLMQSYHIFKWTVEKHFFVEERAIFTAYNPEHVLEGYDLFLDLSKEHTTILTKLNEIENILIKGENVDFTVIKDLLIKHKNSEEQSIYPYLEKEIDEAEKKFIIDRISEII